MSHTKRHLFAYCLENQATAHQIAQDLNQLGVTLEQRGLSNAAKMPVPHSVPADAGQVVLLITDNFLKNTGCMDGALEAIRAWADQGRFVPIIADGHEMAEDGSVKPVPTTFDRVSHIIQYMNFWQDQYLELRKEKRHHEEDSALDEQLEVTKKISADIGELLRYLRTLHCYSIEELQHTKYAILTGYQVAAIVPDSEKPPQQKPPSPGESSLIKMIEDSSVELMAENSELSKEEEADTPEVDISQIPGLDQLPGHQLESPAMETEAAEVPGEEANPTEQKTDGATAERTVSKKSKSSKSKKKGKPKKAAQPSQPPPFDEDDEEMNAILNEVLMEEDYDEDDDEFRFVGDDPENPDDFDIDSLFEDEELEPENGEADHQAAEDSIGEDEVLLEMLDEEEESILMVNGKHATAEEILEHAVHLFDDGQHGEAFSFLAETVQENPQDTTLRYYYAYMMARYGQRYQDALAQLDTILQQDKRHVDALFLKGELTETLEDYAGAKKLFKKVAELDPGYPDIHFRLGLLSVQHFPNKDKEAAGFFKKSVRHDPENAEAHYLLATLLNERLHDTAAAADHFKKTLELSPEHPFANYDLALLYHRQNDLGAAKAFYKKAIALNPELQTPHNDEAFGEAAKAHPAAEPNAAESTLGESGTPTAIRQDAGLDIEDLLAPTVIDQAGKAVASPALQQAVQRIEDYSQDKSFIVLITGATAGIGKATAEIFAKNGHRVIATGRREERLHELKNDFKNRLNADLEILPFDVRDAASAQTAIEKLPADWKNVDILINNAGLSRGLAPIHEGDLEHWDTMIDTNIKGLLYMTRAIAPGMVERRSGHIINVSSNAGKEMYPGGNVYCATKAAVEALTKSMRLDLYQHNVRVSEVSPGHVEETEFAKVRFDGNEERAAKTYENFQPLKSSDVAEAIYFIATRPAYVNIQDVTMFGVQQAGSNFIDRSGRG
ncbi:MAG: SDR family NAD(P)-dependent oxidoreductase [Lewinellaceae bacterium]|nr:SDR family NAD(P)-dependent oxidoreductase [Saprospiraceae bacterium]MCB9339368.1 SDR family NAD(P)-dependent oxidoreductase [Lewinellaceae bacterium]